MPGRTVRNPDRLTTGGQIVELGWQRGATTTVGADLQQNQHSLRMTMAQDVTSSCSRASTTHRWPHRRVRRSEPPTTTPATASWRDCATMPGRRVTSDPARRRWRRCRMPRPARRGARTCRAASPASSATSARDRPPCMQGSGTCNAFRLLGTGVRRQGKRHKLSEASARGRTTTQFDTGVVYSGQRLSASVFALYSDRVDDYILIETGYRKGARAVTVTRNVDARTWGGEADATVALAPHWQLLATLAFTRGENDTGRPAASRRCRHWNRRPGLDYSDTRWSAGLLWRAVTERTATCSGRATSVRPGPRSHGWVRRAVVERWLAADRCRAGDNPQAGIDNLLDKAYAEHLSRGGALVSGYEQAAPRERARAHGLAQGGGDLRLTVAHRPRRNTVCRHEVGSRPRGEPAMTEGRCLCGALHYQINRPSTIDVVHCHCSMCRKHHGAPIGRPGPRHR